MVGKDKKKAEALLNEKIQDSKTIVWLFFFALIPRLIYLCDVHNSPFSQNLILDPLYYDKMAQKIMGGDLLSGGRVFDLSPFYPYFLAAIYSIFGHNFIAARLVQSILGAMNCVLIYLIAKKIFSQKTGIISFFISSLYGIFIFYEGILETETLALFTNSLFLYLLIGKRPLLSGIMLGISAIIRPNVLIVLPLVSLWQYRSVMKKPNVTPVILLLLGTFIMIIPVTARNYMVERDIVLISSSGGMNFYIGNNKRATGILTEPDLIRPNPKFEHKDARKIAEGIAGRKLLPSEASRILFKKGIEYIINNPAAYTALLFKKAYYAINYYEMPDNINYYFFQRFSKLLSLPIFSSRIVIPLGILGILFSIKNREQAAPLYIVAGGYTLFLFLFFVSSRYRLPVMPILIIFSGYSIERLLAERKIKKAIYCYTILLAGLIYFVNRSDITLHNIFLSHSHMILSNILYENGEVDDALKEVKMAVKLNPENAQASNNLAWIYADRGIYLNTALSLALNAIRIDPENSDYYDTLGWVYYKKGDIVKSKRVFENGLSVDPENKNIILHKKIITDIPAGDIK